MTDFVKKHAEIRRHADETGDPALIDEAAALQGHAAEQRLRNSRKPPNGISLPGSGTGLAPTPPRRSGPSFSRTPPAPSRGPSFSR